MADPSNHPEPRGERAAPLGAADLQQFNEYLLQISRSGMPMEQGLGLLSREMGSSKLKGAVDALMADLQAGMPIEQAMARHGQGFPPLYGRLIEVGIRTANLPGVLARFGRHMETVAALRDALWRACAYPTVVFTALLVLLTLLAYGLLPNYFRLVSQMPMRALAFKQGSAAATAPIPLLAWGVYYLGLAAPYALAILGIGAVGTAGAQAVLRASGRDRAWLDRVVLRLPLMGRAARDSYVASWLDVLAIGTESGLDLPQALAMAADAVSLPSLSRDSEAIATQLQHGRPVTEASLKRLPAMIPMAIDLAQLTGRLPQTLSALAEQFQQQAERQIRLIPDRVMPALLLGVGVLAAIIMYTLWMPLSNLLEQLISLT
ncbi:MAG: type II secretion system F family protein [Tepidisphaeraceae bacterium]